MMKRLAIGLVRLYPQAWRGRYEAEMRALVEEEAIGPRELVDLARGSADAHLHPAGVGPLPAQQMRGTVGDALSCWIGFVICGAGFAKLTEDQPFSAAGAAHPVIGVARAAIAVLAVVSAAAVVVGGGRLIVEVIGEALTERRWPLVRAVCAPFAAVAGFVVATGALAWLANGRIAAHTGAVWVAFLAWFGIGLAGAAVCAWHRARLCAWPASGRRCGTASWDRRS
jgi:hypothetical protein